MENRTGGKAVFFKLVLDEADGQPGCIDRHIELFEQIGQAADMVLMPVGDEQALDAILVFQHIGEIRYDEIDAEHFFIREDKAAVNQDHIPLAFIQRNILSHFAETAKRDNMHRDSGFLIKLGGLAAARQPRGGLGAGQAGLAGLARAAGRGRGHSGARPGNRPPFAFWRAGRGARLVTGLPSPWRGRRGVSPFWRGRLAAGRF